MVTRKKDKARNIGSKILSAGSEENGGTTPVREGFHFDENALTAWLHVNIPGFSGPISVTQFRGGRSNPTYKLSTRDHDYVLRRKPMGTLLKGAHAVEREATVLQALGKAGYPVAHVYQLCTDDSVIGSAFYIMDMVEGRIFWDATIPEIPFNERPAYFDAMNAAIAQLHKLDYKALGLNDFGRPGNFFERQIARWSQQYLDDDLAGRDGNMDRLIDWLPANIPAHDDVAITHGDFRIDNLIFHPTEPRILAVLDWELSTLGSAISDFTYHAMMYRMPPDIVAGLGGTDLTAWNIPTETDYIAAYCKRIGSTGIVNYNFYLTFNLFRLAAIFHGIKGRVIRGTAASAGAKERAGSFARLAALAWQQTR